MITTQELLKSSKTYLKAPKTWYLKSRARASHIKNHQCQTLTLKSKKQHQTANNPPKLLKKSTTSVKSKYLNNALITFNTYHSYWLPSLHHPLTCTIRQYLNTIIIIIIILITIIEYWCISYLYISYIIPIIHLMSISILLIVLTY